MPSQRIPKLCRHKTHGLCGVTLSGRDHYLGPWPQGRREPPPAVKAEYDRLIAEWLAGNRAPLRGRDEQAGELTVNELALPY